MDPFPQPTGGASLLLSFRMHSKSVLIVGGDALAASRAYASLEADAVVKILVKGGLEKVCKELRWRAEHGQLEVIDWDDLSYSASSSTSGEEDVDDCDIAALNHYLGNTNISLVCVTDTSSTSPFISITRLRAIHLARICYAHRIPINVADMPDLCDFSFTATHRFVDPASSSKSPLQIGVTTNGEGCRLAGRIRREIVAGLPKDVGAAVTKIGELRKMTKILAKENEALADSEGEDSTANTPNRPVPIRPSGVATSPESTTEASRRQMRWVAQVSEYWPISRLASMTEREMDQIIGGEITHERTTSVLSTDELKSQHGLDLTRPLSKQARGRILLAGSGPGHPSLLTLATHTALTKHADLVLSDKLVPAPVLELIPAHVEVRIARKFPGNADGAQMEMMEAAVEAASRGLTVVRVGLVPVKSLFLACVLTDHYQLKQGDPIVYARVGEELAYFRAHGYAPLVLPGVSSALAAPACAGIPVTHRGVAESFIVCTGVGRQGKAVSLPGYDRARTVLVLMGVARLNEVVRALVAAEHGGRRDGTAYPAYIPIAIVERGSMPDQRVLVSTLEDVEGALANVGEQRPPGMIVVGWAVLAFGRRDEEGRNAGEGVLDDIEADTEEQERRDRQRITRWLGGRNWDVWEGLDTGWAEL